jgi:flagellar assembly factor FliW
MKVQTVRFGEIEVDEARIITMKGCILGFDHLQNYIILLHNRNTPLCWMQSLEDSTVAFVVIDPSVIKPDYHPVLHKTDCAFLEISREEELSFLSIVTIRHNPLSVTANLRAPLVINVEKRLGSQIILEDPSYSVWYAVSSSESNENSGMAKISVLSA